MGGGEGREGTWAVPVERLSEPNSEGQGALLMCVPRWARSLLRTLGGGMGMNSFYLFP